jgi:hypothetical protein
MAKKTTTKKVCPLGCTDLYNTVDGQYCWEHDKKAVEE